MSKNNELSINYLYNSIEDIQGVIRALDTKLNYLLVILMVPLTKFNSIYKISFDAYKKALSYYALEYLVVLIFIFFVLSWVFAFALAIRGIIGIDNPANHVYGTKQKGTFYGGYLYKISLNELFLNSTTQSQQNIEEYLLDVPEEIESIKKELVFEQMKLIYIRSIKMARHRYAFIFGIIWVICGGVIWLASLSL